MITMEPDNVISGTATEEQPICAGPMCCLSFLCQWTHISFHPETLTKVIMSHIYPDGLNVVKEEPENDINIVTTSVVCHQGNESQKSDNTIFICNYASWLKLQPLVQIMSPRWCAIFGCARLHLFPWKGCSSVVWHLNTFQPETIQESKQGQDYIWFCIPDKLCHKFRWVATQKLRLFTRRTVRKEAFLDFLCASECQSSRKIEMVFDVEQDVLFLSGACFYKKWTDGQIAKYVNEVIPISSCSLCRSPSGTYIEDGTKDVITTINTKMNAAIEFEDDLSSTSYLQEPEIQDFDVNHFKEENLKLSEECVVNVHDKEHSDLTSRQTRYGNFRQFLLKYTANAKRRGYHLVTTEPMLIVECPGCSAQFRGLTNRMIRLIDHIQVHGPTSRDQLMNDIQSRYSVLIHLMKARMIKWVP